MGFSNPAQPIDYELIAQLATQGVDYTAVRAACDLALASTDAALGAVATDVDTALVQLGVVVAALSSVSAILSDVQTRPEPPGWSNTRKTALTELLAVGSALDQVNAQLARVPDASPEAAAVVAALESRATALWSDVK